MLRLTKSQLNSVKARLLKARKECEVTSEGCWIWPGYKNSGGYGLISINRTMHLVHRAVYELTIGEIPEGMYVLHRYDNPACFNPAHIFVGTNLDNLQDAMSKGRLKSNTGEHYIHEYSMNENSNNSWFNCCIKRNGVQFREHFPTLEEAVAYRDQILELLETTEPYELKTALDKLTEIFDDARKKEAPQSELIEELP